MNASMNANMNTSMNSLCINNVKYRCPLCEINPSSHSFKIIKNYPTKIVYYTCPAESKSTDTEKILEHYNGILQENYNKEWYWVVDCNGFGIEHALQINTIIQLAKLITKYSTNLQKIIVINTNTFLYTALKIATPFLSEKVNNLIHMK